MLASMDDDRNPLAAARAQDKAAQRQRSRPGGTTKAKKDLAPFQSHVARGAYASPVKALEHSDLEAARWMLGLSTCSSRVWHTGSQTKLSGKSAKNLPARHH